jgi:hypothetical protein
MKFKIISLLLFLFIFFNISHSQKNQDIIEVAEELFLGVPMKATQVKAMSILSNSGKVKNMGMILNNVSGKFISHPLIDVDKLKATNSWGSMNFVLFIENNRIASRRILVSNQTNFYAYNIILSIMNNIKTFSKTETEKELFGNMETISFFTKEKKHFASIVLHYKASSINGEPFDEQFQDISFTLTFFDNL